jgi:hypothetical protein
LKGTNGNYEPAAPVLTKAWMSSTRKEPFPFTENGSSNSIRDTGAYTEALKIISRSVRSLVTGHSTIHHFTVRNPEIKHQENGSETSL